MRKPDPLVSVTSASGLRARRRGRTRSSDSQPVVARAARARQGRKERATPLTTLTVRVLRGWLTEHPGVPDDPLFPTRTGARLSRDAVEHRLAKYTATACASCPSLRGKHVTTHTLRHTAAMRLLHAGIDITVIALWLGHEQIATAQTYLHADLTQKEPAIARVIPPSTRPGRYQPPGALLAFLDQL